MQILFHIDSFNEYNIPAVQRGIILMNSEKDIEEEDSYWLTINSETLPKLNLSYLGQEWLCETIFTYAWLESFNNYRDRVKKKVKKK